MIKPTDKIEIESLISKIDPTKKTGPNSIHSKFIKEKDIDKKEQMHNELKFNNKRDTLQEKRILSTVFLR